MLTRRRIVSGLLLLATVVVAFMVVQAVRLGGDLVAAQGAAQRLRASIQSGDSAARSAAADDLRVHAAGAADKSAAPWWAVSARLPFVGDDVTGIRALSSSIDMVADAGVQPLTDAADDLDGLSVDGRIDLDRVDSLRIPTERAALAFDRARGAVAGLDSSGYLAAFRPRFDEYVDQITGLDRVMGSAATATTVLPEMLGRDDPKDYLLVFQNNAEIRASGGLPGSWALVRADRGLLSIVRQGVAGDFPPIDPPLQITAEEEQAYSTALGAYYQDANFTPDFPRTAGLWRDRYELAFPDEPLAGVVSVDPVALSYLLRATGTVAVGDTALTEDTAVQQLLNQPYLDLQPAAQDVFFAEAARSLFTAVTTQGLQRPVEAVQALDRAAREDRFLVASYDDEVAPLVEPTRITGSLPKDDRSDPHIEITLNDVTASKMSYYLRYRAEVAARACQDDKQRLDGAVTLNQTIRADDAAQLPDSVTGTGYAGTTRGRQTVALRLYSPTGGSIGAVSIDGKRLDELVSTPLQGRQVVTLLVQVDGPDDVVVNWSMQTGAGQTGDGSVGVTPGVLPGSRNSVFSSSC